MTIEKMNLPVEFELQDQVVDDRFLKVKIYIAHTGENLNNSYFTKETLELFSKTLGNIPIVGYIETDKDGNEDFDEHRSKIVIKGSKVDVVYEGHAYGLIPENYNAQFEIKNGKEWLTVEGYLWTKFKDSIMIMAESNGVKSQSMEIEVFDGFVDEQGRMNYTEGRFSGLCILGEDVPPGMKGSTIELFSSKKDFYLEVQEMIAEFSKEKGENELLTEEEKAKASAEFEEEKTDVEVVTEVEETAPKEENFEGDETVEEVVEEPVIEEEASVETIEEVVEVEVEKTETETADFKLSHDNIRSGLQTAIKEQKSADWVWVRDVYDDSCIAEVETYNEQTGYTVENFHVEYTKENDVISIVEYKEVVAMFVTPSEATQIEEQRDEIKDLKNQLGLYTTAEKENKVAEFSEVLGDTADEIRAKFDTMSLSEIEKEVGYHCFQIKQKQEVEGKVSTVNTVDFNGNMPKEANRYGDVKKYFNN